MLAHSEKISLDIEGEVATNFLFSVDCTHCRIKEPHSTPDKKWFSHKLNKPAVSYEIALSIFKNNIAWVNGPFPAGENDLIIFRKEDGLKSKIPINKLLIADKGYLNEVQISTPNEFDIDEIKQFKQRVRARQESVNARIKEYRILSETFRSNHELHRVVFEAVCVIIQFSMESGRPLMDI